MKLLLSSISLYFNPFRNLDRIFDSNFNGAIYQKLSLTQSLFPAGTNLVFLNTKVGINSTLILKDIRHSRAGENLQIAWTVYSNELLEAAEFECCEAKIPLCER